LEYYFGPGLLLELDQVENHLAKKNVNLIVI